MKKRISNHGRAPSGGPRGIALLIRIAALLCLCCSPAAAELDVTIPTQAGSGISIKVTSALQDFVHSGAYPLKVEIANESRSARTWQLWLRSESSLYSPFRPMPVELTRDLTVGPSSRQSFELLAPLPAVSGSGYPSSQYATTWLRGTLTGYGVVQGDFGARSQQSRAGRPSIPPVLVSSKLQRSGFDPGKKLEEELESLLDGRGLAFTGSQVADPALLPADWRALSGFDALMISDHEWQAFQTGLRVAIKEWVMQGGQLHLFMPPYISILAELPAPAGGKSVLALGAGRISFNRQAALTPASFLSLAGDAKASPGARRGISDSYPLGWGLGREVDSPKLNSWLIIILMLAYAVVQGPLNIYKLAGKKRYRLYFTTPIIAAMTAVALFAVILLQDGRGGNGVRMIGALLVPGENKVVVLQEQLARTGLIISRKYRQPRELLTVRISYQHQDSTGTPFGTASSYALPSSGSYSIDEGDGRSDALYYGSWFGSRSLHAHLLASVRPTRARLDVISSQGAAPVAASSIQALLERVAVAGSDGRFWEARDLRPGERRALSDSGTVMPPWIGEAQRRGGPAIQSAFKAVREAGPYVVALARGASEFGTASLPSIAWQNDQVLFFGAADSGGPS